jgi:hypothetical protein
MTYFAGNREVPVDDGAEPFASALASAWIPLGHGVFTEADGADDADDADDEMLVSSGRLTKCGGANSFGA